MFRPDKQLVSHRWWELRNNLKSNETWPLKTIVHILNFSAVRTYSNFLHQISSLINLSLLLFDFRKSFDQSCSLYLDIYLQYMHNCEITHTKTMDLKEIKNHQDGKVLTLPAETLLNVLISSMRVSMSGVKSMYSIAFWTMAVMACDK